MKRRLATIIAAIAVTASVLAVPSVATAVWWSEDSVASTASAATVSLTQDVQSLTTTYTSNAQTTAAAVTVTNTGTRDSTYTVSTQAVSATNAALPAAIAVTIGVVANVAACTPSATLPSPTTGVFSTGSAVAHSGPIGVGNAVVVCLQTSMAPADIASFAGESMAGHTWASIAAGSWSDTGSTETFTQSVQAAPAPDLNPWGWYRITSALPSERCVSTASSPASTGSLVRQQNCGDVYQLFQQWRFTPTSDGYYYLENRSATTQQIRPNGGTVGSTVGVSAQNMALSEWIPIANGDGTVSFQNRQYPTLCFGALSNGNNAQVSMQTCDPSVTGQKYNLGLIGDPTPAPVTLTCSAPGGWNAYLGWPQLTDYEAEVTYRVLVDGVVIPSSQYTRATGHDPVVQFNGFNFAVANGLGPHTVAIEQTVNGSPWMVTGTGSLTVNAGIPLLECG